MRVKIDYRQCSKKNYFVFKQENPEIDLDYSQWSSIIYRFNEHFRDHLYETGDKEKLPYGFGSFAVCKFKPSNPRYDEQNRLIIKNPVDWKMSRLHGKIIYHMNAETDGFKFKLKWFPHSSTMKYSDVFYFRNSRVSSRLLKQYIIDNNYKDKYLNW